jgi:radical SAM protein with 4Fe4S-binding SPASM domain
MMRRTTVLRNIIDSLGRRVSPIQGRGKKSQSSIRTPYMVVWNFTNMCNLKCKHCYQDAGPSPTPDELSLEEKFDLVDRLVDSGVKIPVVSGGEPLIHPDFFPVLERMVGRGMHTAAASNATTISKEVAQRLKESGLNYIEISLDSVRPERHDEFRGAEGTWQQTVDGLKNCVEAGIFTAVATVFTRSTVGEVDEMVDFTASIGAQRFIHFNFVPTGRGPGIADQDLTPEEREHILTRLFKKRRTSGIEVLSTAPQYARVCIEQSLGVGRNPDYVYVESRGKNSSQYFVESPTHFSMVKDQGKPDVHPLAIKGCGAGRLFCCIQPNGDVTPCMFIPGMVVGNLREESFEAIWERMVAQPCFTDREALEGNCGECSYRYVCGGCRARAINYSDEPLGPDTGCKYNLEKWLEEHEKRA